VRHAILGHRCHLGAHVVVTGDTVTGDTVTGDTATGDAVLGDDTTLTDYTHV
jgi:hypothetical protein